MTFENLFNQYSVVILQLKKAISNQNFCFGPAGRRYHDRKKGIMYMSHPAWPRLQEPRTCTCAHAPRKFMFFVVMLLSSCRNSSMILRIMMGRNTPRVSLTPITSETLACSLFCTRFVVSKILNDRERSKSFLGGRSMRCPLPPSSSPCRGFPGSKNALLTPV